MPTCYGLVGWQPTRDNGSLIWSEPSDIADAHLFWHDKTAACLLVSEGVQCPPNAGQKTSHGAHLLWSSRVTADTRQRQPNLIRCVPDIADAHLFWHDKNAACLHVLQGAQCPPLVGQETSCAHQLWTQYKVTDMTTEYIGVELKYCESICLLSWSVYTATLYIREGKQSERGWVCTPSLTSLGLFFHHDGMYARNRPSPLCVYSVDIAQMQHIFNKLEWWNVAHLLWSRRVTADTRQRQLNLIRSVPETSTPPQAEMQKTRTIYLYPILRNVKNHLENHIRK